MKELLEKNRLIATISVIYICFFIMNFFVPMITDDYSFSLHKINGTSEIYTDFFGFCEAVKRFYFNHGGRIFGYIFTQFTTVIPNWLYALINSAVYVSMTVLLYKLIMIRGAFAPRIIIGNEKNLFVYLSINFLLWKCTPDFGDAIFWKTGSANYLWTSILVLCTLHLFRRELYLEKVCNKTNIASVILASIGGFLGGAAFENMSAGLLVIETLYLLYFKVVEKKHVNVLAVITYLSSLIGFAALMLAPGNYVRMNAASKVGGELSVPFAFAVICYYWMVIMLPICMIYAVLIVYLWNRFGENIKKVFLKSAIYMVAAFCSAFCMIIAKGSPERTWYIVVVYGTIAIGMLLCHLDWSVNVTAKWIKNIVVLSCACYLLVGYADTVVTHYDLYGQYKAREAFIEEQKKRGNLKLEVPIFDYSYPLRHHHDALYGQHDISTDSENWINELVANYYGLDSITGVIDGYR